MRSCLARTAAGLAGVLCLLSIIVYFRALSLPLISDDYLQIELGRMYGPVNGWAALALDPLYRCRATSLLVTHWTGQVFGFSVLAFNASSLLFHVANSMLVFALGAWRRIGSMTLSPTTLTDGKPYL
jgi:hypothetical protein